MAKIKKACKHDYKNAIQVGNVDYMCPLCKKLLDPMEWFFMNSFEFVEVKGKFLDKKQTNKKRTVENKLSFKKIQEQKKLK
jgi:hypothetical protein